MAVQKTEGPPQLEVEWTDPEFWESGLDKHKVNWVKLEAESVENLTEEERDELVTFPK